MKKVGLFASLALVATASAALGENAQGVAGTLTCKGKGTVGMIIGSKEALDCNFVTTKGQAHRYAGTITKIGLDIGVRGENTLIWTVVYSTAEVPVEGLAGTYGGVSADASVGIGGGANVLVGGSKNSVTLQPLSVQGQTGLNIATGVSGLTLTPAP